MAVIRKRNRLVSFRLSEQEYAALQSLTITEGARSISDFARGALCEVLGTTGESLRMNGFHQNGQNGGYNGGYNEMSNRRGASVAYRDSYSPAPAALSAPPISAPAVVTAPPPSQQDEVVGTSGLGSGMNGAIQQLIATMGELNRVIGHLSTLVVRGSSSPMGSPARLNEREVSERSVLAK